MLQAMALVTFSLNKIVGNLFHYSLVIDIYHNAVQDTSTRTVVIHI